MNFRRPRPVRPSAQRSGLRGCGGRGRDVPGAVVVRGNSRSFDSSRAPPRPPGRSSAQVPGRPDQGREGQVMLGHSVPALAGDRRGRGQLLHERGDPIGVERLRLQGLERRRAARTLFAGEVGDLRPASGTIRPISALSSAQGDPARRVPSRSDLGELGEHRRWPGRPGELARLDGDVPGDLERARVDQAVVAGEALVLGELGPDRLGRRATPASPRPPRPRPGPPAARARP